MALLGVPWTSMALHRTLKRYWPHCTLFGSFVHLYIMAQIIFISPFSTLVIIVECLVGVTGLGGTNCFNADHCYFEIRILSKHDL